MREAAATLREVAAEQLQALSLEVAAAVRCAARRAQAHDSLRAPAGPLSPAEPAQATVAAPPWKRRAAWRKVGVADLVDRGACLDGPIPKPQKAVHA